ncbi:hypothetical protein Holit_02066 [Hollandina sp. SP2]
MAGILSLMLVFGFALTACDTSGGDDSGNGSDDTLPAARGKNDVSGKTYFEGSDKIAFSTTSEGATTGTYSVFSVKWGDSGRPILEDGKYTYAETKTGAYVWNGDAKTISLSTEKAAIWDAAIDGYGPLQTKSKFRAAQQEMFDTYKEQMGDEAFNDALQEAGFSSLDAYLDYYVNETFSNTTYVYSFSEDSTALFLEEALPENKGSNALSGQTYYGVTYGDSDEAQKDTSQVYTFNADGTYTFTGGEQQEGKYSFDTTYKIVYLQPQKVNGKTRAAYYAEQTASPGHYYIDDNACRGAQTNVAFRVDQYRYDSAEKTLR